MGITATVSNVSFAAVPADVYPVVVSKIEEKEMEFGPTILVSFTISDGEHAATVITGLASKSLNVKAKLRGWVEAITGKNLANAAEGTNVDLERLVGKPCRISVSVVPGKDGTGEFNRVTSVLPIRAARPAQPAPKPVEAGNGDELF